MYVWIKSHANDVFRKKKKKKKDNSLISQVPFTKKFNVVSIYSDTVEISPVKETA